RSGGPYVAAVTADYFRTMGTAVRRGRGFTPTDVLGSQRVAVVNETMARLLWPHEGPVGERLKIGGKNRAACTEVTGGVHEMGIRIALGAGTREVLELVMGQALRVTAWGVVLGVGGALAAGRAIASLLYGVTPHDPLVLSLVIVILGAVAALASYLPARRATRVDPMVALRYE